MEYHGQEHTKPEKHTKQNILMMLSGMLLMVGLLYITNGNVLSVFGQKWYSTYEFNVETLAARDSLLKQKNELAKQLIEAQTAEINRLQFQEALAVAYFMKGYSKSSTVKKGNVPAFLKSIEDDYYLMKAFVTHGRKYLDSDIIHQIFIKVTDQQPKVIK